ncbi:unnamed protein product, partial [Notodromas monacha]
MSPLSFLKIDAAEAALNESRTAKWKLALALGVPFVAVLGACYYWSRSDSKKQYAKKLRKAVDDSNKLHFPAPGNDSASKVSGPDLAEAVSRRGNTLYRSGMYAEALEEFTKAIDMCPHSAKRDLAILYRNRASCYEQLVI